MNVLMGHLRRVAFLALVSVALGPGLRAADCNENGVEDADDIAAGMSQDCNTNEIPDECDVAARRIDYSAPRRFATSLWPDELPGATVTGDFDGDGDLDLVIAHAADSTAQETSVALLRNAGDGIFAHELITRGRITTLPRATALVSADLEGDGDLDLVLSFIWDERVVRGFLNRGDGTFPTSVPLLEGHQIVDLVAADLDNDGDVDLAGTNYCPGVNNSCLVILLNQDGDFSVTTSDIGVETGWRRLRAADIDGDGSVDLLIENSNQRFYWLFLNDGGAQFRAPEVLSLGPDLWRFVSGDFDGDDDIDVATGPNLFFNNGHGVFGPPVELDLEVYAAEDLDLDGDLDLLATRRASGVLLLNDGSGSFEQIMEFPLLDVPTFFGAMDIDGDGAKDLLAVLARNEVSVRFRLAGDAPRHPDVNENGILDVCEPDCNRNGVPDTLDMTAGTSKDCNENGFPDECDVANENGILDVRELDCNRNGVPDTCDVAAGTSRDCNENGFPDECDVTTEVTFDVPVPYFEWVSASTAEAFDLDGDGDLDMAVPHSIRGDIQLLRNLGDGTFRPLKNVDLGIMWPRSLVAADLDDDGNEDLAATSNRGGLILVLLNNGSGSFRGVTSFPAGPSMDRLLAVDIDLDGNLDLLAENNLMNSPEVYLLRNRGDATFEPFESLFLGSELIATDVDGDGAPDLIAEDFGRTLIYLNDGSGDFSHGEELVPGRVFVAADFDGDGDVDLVSEGQGRSDRQLLWNDGHGGFEARSLPGPAQWSRPTAVDLDGDGDVDLAANDGGLVVIRNDGPDGAWLARSLPGIPGSPDIVAGDWNGDGKMDLALPGSDRSVFVVQNRTTPSPSRDQDRNGIPDECDPDDLRFLRGDCNADGDVNLSDAVCTLDRLFSRGRSGCFTALDANGDVEVNLTDAVFLLDSLFAGGPALVEPFPDCGRGREADRRLGCTDPPDC